MNYAVAVHLSRRSDNPKIVVWDIDEHIMETVRDERIHPYHFVEDVLPESIVTGTLDDFVDVDHVIIGMGAQNMRSAMVSAGTRLKKPYKTIVSKGLLGTGKRLSQVVQEEVGDDKIAMFAGGTVAHDLFYGNSLAADVAAIDPRVRYEVAELLHSNTLRIYEVDDLVGVELIAALKNIISMGAGMAESLHNSVGTKSSFKIRLEYEVFQLAMKMGANMTTFLPGRPSWSGDTNLSSFGKTRNREYGMRIGGGEDPDDALKRMERGHKTVEGYYTLKVAHDLTRDMDTPCIDQLYAVVYGKVPPLEAEAALMSRARRRD